MGAETLAFEGTHRALQSLSGNHENPNLWRWNGNGGLREGLTSTLFTIGSLKAFGTAYQGQSLLLQHFASDLRMLASQNALGLLGWIPRPQGSSLEQLAHAEVLRLQLAAGGEFLRTFVPSLSLLERNLEFSIQSVKTQRSIPANEVVEIMAGNRDDFPDPDGRTIADASLIPRMAETRDKARAENFERVWRLPGTVLKTEELIWYAKYCFSHPAYEGEGGTVIVSYDSVYEQVRRELTNRGVNVMAIILSALPPSPPPSDDASDQKARVIDMNVLLAELQQRAINLSNLGNSTGSEGNTNTQAVSPDGILRMLDTGNNAGVGSPQNAALAVVPPPLPTPSQRSLGQRFYDATLGKIWPASRPTTQTNPSPLQLSFRGPFHFDSATNTYRYRFPRGSRTTTMGRGWTVDHRITGDSQLSRKHITIQRRIEPETTAYILTAHNLTVIHRARGGATETFDHDQTAWLNPGDRVVLTPHVSFIFAPE